MTVTFARLVSGSRGLAALLALTVLASLPTTASAQTSIESLSTGSVVVGDTLEVLGTGFGPKPPKVWLSTDGKKRAKGTQVKLVDFTSDGLLVVQVAKAREGDYTLMVKPKGKGRAPVTAPAVLGIEGPEILSVDNDEAVFGNDEVSVLVSNPSAKANKLFVAGKNAKIVSKQATEDAGVFEYTIRVPTSVPNGTWDVSYTDNVGRDVDLSGLTVVGSNKKLGNALFSADLDGFKPFKATGKAVKVGASFSGPTTVWAQLGGNNGRVLELVLPFVYGSDLAPRQYSEGPSMILYEETQKGTTTVELMSEDESFTILVSAEVDGMISGSFYGDLYPMTEGVEAVETFGRFVYDGRYDLETSDGLTSKDLAIDEVEPGLTVQVMDVKGASGPTGNFQPGDRMQVTFRMVKDDGTAWRLEDMYRGRVAVSGPTFNYQRVIAQISDVHLSSVDNGNGTYTYTLPPLPEKYLAPYGGEEPYDEKDMVLAGQALLDGTYTLGLWMEWRYTANGSSYRDVGTDLRDLLLGASVTETQPRAVVASDNCNACHGDLQFHGGGRRGAEVCLLCHTSGMVDDTGASVDMKIMIHKIHNGAYLPSTLGVTTDMNGDRVYDAEAKPYEVGGKDYSHIILPAWPHLNAPMPADAGYSDLDGDVQDLEDQMRSATTNCALCHGDPDGDGPIEAPINGDLAYTQLRRTTCGSCHDDWVFEFPYKSNTNGMPPQTGDATCAQCHPESGSSLAVRDAHVHPLMDPDFATGLVFDVQSVAPASEGTGNVSVGDRIAITMYLKDAMGNEIAPDTFDAINLAITGPTDNMNLLLGQQGIPAERLTGDQPYVFSPPMRVYFEILGTATAAADEFQAGFLPMWDASGHATEVFQRTGTAGGDSQLMAAVVPPVNFIDVADPSGFARNDYIVIDDGEEGEEYLRIQNVIDNRLWFSSPYTASYAPGPVNEHALDASVKEVTLETLSVKDGDYTLDAENSLVTEGTTPWIDDAVIICTYSTDFVVPDVYGITYNGGPDLTERDGVWTGKSIVDGTYTLAIWGEKERVLMAAGEETEYTDGAPGVRHDFLFGSADELEPWDKLSSTSNCYSCHVDIQFHGDHRRGIEACLSCHGVVGSGDRPQYVAKGADATDGTTVSFREMVHKIHRGEDLAKGDEYVVNGYGFAFDGINNFTPHKYDHVVYPKMPRGVLDCASCHGEDNGSSWIMPRDTAHPTEAILPAREWAVVCGACHDDDTGVAHIQSMSSPVTGAESCLVCHAPGQAQAVDKMHILR